MHQAFCLRATWRIARFITIAFALLIQGCGILEIPYLFGGIVEGGARAVGLGPPSTTVDGDVMLPLRRDFLPEGYARMPCLWPSITNHCSSSFSLDATGTGRFSIRLDRPLSTGCVAFGVYGYDRISQTRYSRYMGEVCLAGIPCPGLVHIRNVKCAGGTCSATEVVSEPAGVRFDSVPSHSRTGPWRSLAGSPTSCCAR